MFMQTLISQIVSALQPNFKRIETILGAISAGQTIEQTELTSIEQFIGELDAGQPGPAVAGRIFVGGVAGETLTLRGDTMLQLTDSQFAQLTVAFVDAKGAPADVASTSWSSSDPTKATVTPGILQPDKTIAPDPSNLNAVVSGVLPGTAQANVSGTDADGTVANVPALDITVVAGDAVSGSISAGTPV
jgi:hypothetical protein